MRFLKYCAVHLISIGAIVLEGFLEYRFPDSNLTFLLYLTPLLIPVIIFFSKKEIDSKIKDITISPISFIVDFVIAFVIYMMTPDASSGSAGSAGALFYIVFGIIGYLIAFSLMNWVLIGLLKNKKTGKTLI